MDIKNEKIENLILDIIIDGKYIFIDSIYKKDCLNNKPYTVSKSGYYFLKVDKRCGVPLYLDKGFNFTISLSGFNRFSFDGNGSYESEYLLRDKYHPLKMDNYKYFSLTPDLFIKALDKTFEPYFDLIGRKYKKKCFLVNSLFLSIIAKNYRNA